MTCVRVAFLEKNISPPLPNEPLLGGGRFVRGGLERKKFPPFFSPSVDKLFVVEAVFARFYVLEKNGFLLLIFLCMARTMGAEPEEKNVSPLPGIHLSIFLMLLLFRTFGTSKSLGRWWALVVPSFRAEGFPL